MSCTSYNFNKCISFFNFSISFFSATNKVSKLERVVIFSDSFDMIFVESKLFANLTGKLPFKLNLP